ncbi:hypothetical protein OROHE_023049 [Orobanche hederae]
MSTNKQDSNGGRRVEFPTKAERNRELARFGYGDKTERAVTANPKHPKEDEEDTNMKERVRAEVRLELSDLEISCHSMASLLHLLGITVGGWPYPLPQQEYLKKYEDLFGTEKAGGVQTAYKRALLTFHPDRASQSDIRQQVEAEEKFKLINRLKEKFSPNV